MPVLPSALRLRFEESETEGPAALALSLNAPLLGRGVCVALRVPAPGFKQLRYAPAPLGEGLRLLVGLGNIPSFALLLSAPLRSSGFIRG